MPDRTATPRLTHRFTTALQLAHGYDVNDLRKKTDIPYISYNDLNHLPPETDDEIVFLGGKDYVPLFHSLTSHARGTRKIFYNSDHSPDAEGCQVERFVTRTKTNWYYECTRWLASQKALRGDRPAP